MTGGDRNSYYNKIIKHKRENEGEIRCSYCRYHRGENISCRTYRKWPRKRNKIKIDRQTIRRMCSE